MDTKETLGTLYSEHNTKRRGEYFVLLEGERGPFLRDHIGNGKHVLDIGCRDGALTRYFADGNVVTGLDIDQDALERAKKIIPITTRQIDLNGDWDIPPGSFDVVVAAEVLEHLYYPDVVIGKAERALTDTGLFIGSVPYAYSAQSKLRFLFGMKKFTPLHDPTHINHFTYKEFRSLLEKHFMHVHIVPIISKKFKPLSFIFPYSFAHSFLFYATHPRHEQ